METILAKQLLSDTARISENGSLQVEQLFEIETLLGGIKESIDTGIVELFSIIDDTAKLFEKELLSSTKRLEGTLYSLSPNVADSVLKPKSDFRTTTGNSDEQGYDQTKEDFIESSRETKKQTELLQEIANNTAGMVPASSDKKDDGNGMSSFFGALLGTGFLGKFIRGFGAGMIALFSIKSITKAVGGSVSKFVKGIFGSKGIFGNFGKSVTGLFANMSKTVATLMKNHAWISVTIKSVKSIMTLASGIFRLVSAPLTLILGTLVGLWDAVEEYSENGDLVDAVKAFFGGLIHTLTFGIIDKDFTLNEDGFILGLITDLGALVREKIFVPLGELWDSIELWFAELDKTIQDGIASIGKSARENVFEPIDAMWKSMTGWIDQLKTDIETGISDVVGAVRENILDPIVDKFKGIVAFVIDIKNKLFSMFENMEIPKIGFKIPWTEKEFSAGPWYPFKPTVKPVEPPPEGPGSTAPGRAGELMKNSPEPDNSRARESKPMRMADIDGMRDPAGTHANTGTFKFISGSTEYSETKRDASGKLVKMTYKSTKGNEAKQAMPLPAEPKESDDLMKKSNEVADKKDRIVVAPSTNVISAPTTNNVSNTSNHVKVPPRNSDSTLSKYIGSWFR